MAGGLSQSVSQVLSCLDRRGWREWILWLFVVGATTSAAYAVIAFPLGLSVPTSWSGDSLGMYMMEENFRRYGPTHSLPGLAYPFGGSMLDFPQMPNYVFIFTLWFASLTSGGDPILAANLTAVVIVTLNALSAFLCLKLTLRNSFASACASVLFALTYFAFVRATSHAMVLSYTALPLIFCAVFLIGISSVAWTRARVAAAIAFAMLAALSSAYHVIFGVVVIGGAGVFYNLFTRRFTHAAAVLGLGCITVATACLVSFPVLLNSLAHGQNEAISTARTASLTVDANALRLSYLFTYPGPRPGQAGSDKFFEWLAAGRPATESWSAYSASLVTLGILSAGILIGSWRSVSPQGRLAIIFCGVIASMACLTLLPGSMGDYLIYIVQPIRALNRGVTIIHLVSAALFAIAIAHQLREEIPDKQRWRRIAAFVAGPLALVIVVWDQARSPDVATLTAAKAALQEDRAFFSQVDAQLGQAGGHDVFQLPYQFSPEYTGPEGMAAFDALRPFILLPKGRTSAFSFPGTASSVFSVRMQDLFRAGQFATLMQKLRAAGFEGITIDRVGLNAWERVRLGQLLEAAPRALDGGDQKRFVYVAVAPNTEDPEDKLPVGDMLASYGPISIGSTEVSPRYTQSGGIEQAFEGELPLIVTRYADKQMRTVFQFQLTCDRSASIRVDGLANVERLQAGPTPGTVNLLIELPGPQLFMKLSEETAGSQGAKCTLDKPGVTFFE